MRFKVPQDVQREDQILWFITLRQLILILVGFGLSYFIMVTIQKSYEINTFELIVIWIPAAIAVAFAFLKIHGIKLFKFILLQIEQFLFRSPRRRWISHSGDAFISMTTEFSMKTKAKKETPEAKNISAEKIKNLAKIL